VPLILAACVPIQGPGFLERLYQAYTDDWKGTATSGPEPPRRGLSSRLNSPPFPNSDWSYGGAPEIGVPDTKVPPLMQALYAGPHAKAWQDSRVKVYGWIEASFNLSTSHHSNAPAAYDIYANRFELDQAVLYIERIPDGVQPTHLDWGFHLSGLFGTSYRFTTNEGYFSQQLLDQHRQYGFDPVLEYFDLYVPQVADGLNIMVGRFISVPGIEAQLAPNNYIYTHSLLYSIDPFTDTGIMATVKLNDLWLLQLGLTASHDVAPWTSDARPSATACLSFTFHQGNDNIYACVNGLNSGTYSYNNLQMFITPGITNSVTPGTWPPKPGICIKKMCLAFSERSSQRKARMAPFALLDRFAASPPSGPLSIMERQISAKNYLSIRSDFLDDYRGQRTGFRTRYAEESLMWGHWIGTTVLLPELRFDHAFEASAYDNGTRRNQFQLAMDAIFKF
jgi:hypothetical protein